MATRKQNKSSKPAEGQGSGKKTKTPTSKTIALGKDPRLSELIAWAEQNGLEIKFSLNSPLVEAKRIKE